MQKIKEAKKKIHKHFKNPFFLIYSIIAGLMVTLTKILFPILPHRTSIFQSNEIHILTFENLLIFIIFTVFSYVVITLLYSAISKAKPITLAKQHSKTTHVFIVALIVSIIVFLVAFLVYYPGLGMNDTINAFRNFVENNHQPPAFQAILYGIFHLSYTITGSANIGYATITLLQIIAASGIIAYFVSWLYSHRVRTWVILIAAMFLICSPLIADYTISVLKDTWFAYAFLLLLPNLYDYITFKKPNIINKILLLISLFGIWISRPNGCIITIVLCVVLLVVFFKNKSKRIFLTVSIIVFLAMGLFVNKILVNRSSQNQSFRESMSIPIAQIGAVVNSGGEMSQEDKEIIDKILPLEKWGDNYRYSFVDTIKFDENFDNTYLLEHKIEFIKAWFSIALKNPGVYMRAYLLQTYGLWNIAYWDTENIDLTQSLFKDVINNIPKDNLGDWEEWLKTTKLYNHSLLSPDLTVFLDSYYQNTSVTVMYINTGVMILICLGCLVFVVVSKKYNYIIIFLPVFLSWGSMMIGTPASMIYRYNFYLLLALPFIIIATIMSLQNHIEAKGTKQKSKLKNSSK